MPVAANSNRLVELDALRGIAATLVMLFHYTTRYDQLFGHTVPPAVFFSWGHYGVNLFFMISGFVIFMTLHRVSRPLDFIVSRFSRLFPAFWVAVILTFALTHLFDLPGKTVGTGTALLNLAMIHGLFKVPNVDGVYWTLEIELIFYAMALALYMIGQMRMVHVALVLLILIRLVSHWLETSAGIHISWTFSHLLILPYIAWFACGIMIYRRVMFPDVSPRKDAAVIAIAILQLAAVDGWVVGLLAPGLAWLFWAAASGRLPLLANPVLIWLGAISYTLYLLHENIGWGIIMTAERAGISSNGAILAAIATSLTLASALTWYVERPVMTWLRGRYRRRIVAVA
jgi:peptidoglycan/LPS O-acetylase OafA/YrhL